MGNELTEYVKEQMENGFTIDQIRQYLINYGYLQTDVENALYSAEKNVNTPSLVQTGPLTRHPLHLKIVAAVLILFSIGALFLFLGQRGEVGTVNLEDIDVSDDVTPIIMDPPRDDTVRIPQDVQQRIDFALSNLENAEQTQYTHQERLEYLDDAIVSLRQVIKEQPKDPDSRNYLADALESKGLLDEAEQEYLVALELDPDDAETYNDLGFLYAKQGKTETALEYYNIAIEKDPTFDVPYSNLGMYHYQNGDYDEAIRNFVTAKELRPFNFKTLNNLGFAYYQKGMNENAIAEFRAALELNPEFPNPYFGLGLVYMTQQQFSQAVYQLEKSVVLDPSNFIYQEAYSQAKKNIAA